MSKDPAFLFYDGDAAKDVSHLNRLERGCYFDLIQAQRKFGKMKIELIKKILGKDFDQCWPSLEICLTYDNHMYFITWVEESINKRRLYCESRRNNRLIQNNKDMSNICKTYDKHMENEIEIEDKDVIKEKIHFKPPLLEEVKSYCLERKNSVNAQDFIDFYESKGWMVGKSKMKDWKASLRRAEKWHATASPIADRSKKEYDKTREYLASLEK